MEDKRVLALDNKYKGHRGFVIGGGPSLKEYPPDLIEALSREVAVGANHAFLLFTPTFLVFIDKKYWLDFHKEVKKVPCPKLCPLKLSGPVSGREVIFFNTGNHTRDRLAPKSFFDRIPYWNNAGVTALRVAYILGCDPIYLVGIDLNKTHKEAGITHFHDAYDQKRKNATRISRYDSFADTFNKTIAEIKDREIYSCSPYNILDIPFVPLEEVLGAEIIQREAEPQNVFIGTDTPEQVQFGG